MNYMLATVLSRLKTPPHDALSVLLFLLDLWQELENKIDHLENLVDRLQR